MKGTIGHVGISVSSAARSFPLWKDLCAYFGLTITEDGQHFDASDGRMYLCITVTGRQHRRAGFHRKRTGLSHVAFRVASKKCVDQFVREFLVSRDITPLYGGARKYPEYAKGYYAVYFEDPDRIKIEVACDPSV